MVDLFCGPNLPLGKAFLYCGWRCLPVDWALDPSHDLSNPQRQDSIREQLQDAVFAAAALDCSTKSRAREIPRDLGDGKPGPLRSDRYPEGIPDLPMADQLRVSKDNLACSFVLTELQALADRGGGSVRENPLRSLHWELTQEKQMMATGLWQDTVYSACCFMGARCKAQRLRHNIDEIAHGLLSIATTPTQPTSGSLIFKMVSVCSPPRKRRNTPPRWLLELQSLLPGGPPAWGWRSSTCPVSPLWKAQAGGNIGCRLIPGPSGSGQWHLQLSPLGCAQLTRKRGQGHLIGHAWWTSSWKTRPCHLHGVVYVGRGHHSHRLPVTKWSSPFVPGHNCDPSSWLPLYVEHIMQHLAGDLPELTGCVLACDCEMHIVCEGDALTGLVFESGRPPARTKKKRQAGASGQVRRVLAAVAALPPRWAQSSRVGRKRR